jgi:hypothetical protein
MQLPPFWVIDHLAFWTTIAATQTETGISELKNVYCGAKPNT